MNLLISLLLCLLIVHIIRINVLLRHEIFQSRYHLELVLHFLLQLFIVISGKVLQFFPKLWGGSKENIENTPVIFVQSLSDILDHD